MVLSRFTICLILLLTVAVTSFADDKLPEWDGVYIKNTKGDYIEVPQVPQAIKFYGPNPQGIYSYENPKFFDIPANEFKGILIKGRDLIDNIQIRSTRRQIKGLFSFKMGTTFDYQTQYGFPDMRKKSLDNGNAVYMEPTNDPRKFFGSAEDGYYAAIYYKKGTRLFTQGWVFGILPAKQSSDSDKPSQVPSDKPADKADKRDLM